MSHAPDPRRRYMVAGVVVLTVALWLILDAMGVGVPPLRRFWPVFILAGGLASLVFYLIGGRQPSSLGKSVAGIGVSLLAFGFTYDKLQWLEVGDWMPALPLILGSACFATWVAGRRTPALLVTGVVGIVLGLTFYAPRFAWLEKLLPPPALIWGLVLAVLGGYLLWRSMKQNRDSSRG